MTEEGKIQEFVDFACERIQHVGLREGLIGKAREDLCFAWEMAARYFASEDGKADIEAFFEPMVDSDQTAAERMEELAREGGAELTDHEPSEDPDPYWEDPNDFDGYIGGAG